MLRHVLVMEGDPQIRELIRMALEAEGCWRVTVAATPESALPLLFGDTLDVLLIDIVLRRPSTVALAMAGVGLDVRVLLMTGEPDTRCHLEALGCDFLAKPFRLAELIDAVRVPAADGFETPAKLGAALRSIASFYGIAAPEWPRLPAPPERRSEPGVT
jgi:DNA-binding NtrC family response regulator